MVACNLNIDNKEFPISSVFTPDKLARYSSFMNAIIGDIFTNYISDKNYSISQLTNPKVVDEIYSRAKTLIDNIIAAHDVGFGDGSNLPIGFSSEADRVEEPILDDLDKIINNYDSFIQFHKLSSNLFVTNREDVNEILNEETNQNYEDNVSDNNTEMLSDEENSEKNKEYDKSANEEDPYQMLHNDVKTLFKLPVKTEYNPSTKRIEISKDSNGLPLSAPDNSVYTLLMSKINDIKDENILLDKISDPNLHKIIPEIPQILKILNIKNWTERSDEQKELWLKFHNNFSKPSISVQSLVTLKNNKGITNVFLQEDIKGNSAKIKKLWESNFNLSKLVKKDTTGKTFFSKDDIPTIRPNEINSALTFLNKLGINISTSLFEESNKTSLHDSIVTYSNRLYDTINKVFTSTPDYQIRNPLAELSDGFSQNLDFKTRSESSSINALVNIESKYTTLVPTMSTRNSEGELQYLIANESNISLTTHYLKNSESISDLFQAPPFKNLKNNPLYKASTVLNTLFDKNGKKRNDFSINLAFFSGDKNSENKGNIIRNFTDRNKIMFDFQTMINYGKTDVMRTETSHSFYSLAIQQQSSLENTALKNKLFFDIPLFTNGWLDNNLVSSQFLSYLNAEIERIQSYPEKLEELPSLTSEYGEFSIFYQLSEGLKNELKSTIVLTESDPLYPKFVKEYSAILDGELKDFENSLIENKISDKDLLSKTITDKYNTATALQLKKAFLLNNIVQNIEFSILYSGDSLFYKDMHKRLKGLSSTGIYTNISNTANELVNSSSYQNNGSYRAQLKNDGIEIPFKSEDEIFSNVLNDRKATDYPDFLYKDSKVETTDGQGWIHPDFLQELSIRQGWQNEFTDRVFKYESLVFKKDILNKKLSKAEQAIYQTLETQIYANPDSHSISVMKGGYFGSILNTSVDGKAYDKFSLAPLLPSFVKNQPKLKQMLLDMTKSNKDYIKYNTGTKGFKTQSINSNELNSASPDILSKNLFKLQISYSNEAKNKTSIPTQLLKLIYGNQFSSGDAKTSEIKGLYDNYLSTLSSVQKEQTKKLFDSLGISINNDDVSVDYKKLSDKLLNESIKRGMNSNIQYALKYNKENNYFNTTPEIAASSEIEKLLSSIMDKSLRRFKINGGDFVLVSNAESERLQPPRKNDDGSIQKGEIRITLTKEFSKLLKRIHPDGNKIATLDRLNQLIANKADGSISSWAKENEKSLSVILDRVPTQELNSMDVGRVVEFLTPTIGNVVQMYDEIVEKAGLDFDFDKEKTLTPSFDDYGNHIDFDETTSDTLNKEINELSSQSVNYVKDSTKDISSIIKQVKSINFQQYKASKEVRDNINNLYNEIGINIEDVKNLVEEVKSLVKQVNNERDVEDYIQYKEASAANLLMGTLNIDESTFYHDALQESKSELDNKLINLYTLYKSREDGFLQLQQLNEQFNSLKDGLIISDRYKEFKEYSNKLRGLLNQQSNFSENLSNKIVTNYIESLLQPDRYDEMMKPNSAKYIKDIALENAKRTQTDMSMPNHDGVYYYTKNNRVFSIFFNSKKMLAPYAKVNTLQQVIAYTGVKLNTELTKIWSPTYQTKTNIYHLLLSEEEQNKIQKDGKLDISDNNDINNNEKQIVNSQSINATADAAKDPYFSALNLNYRNIGVKTLMSLMGYPEDRIISFLSNTGLQSYFNNLLNGMSKIEAKADIVKRLKLTTKQNYKDIVVTEEKYIALNSTPDIDITSVKYVDKAKSKDRILTYTQNDDINIQGKGISFSSLMKAIQTNNKEWIGKSGISSSINGVTTSLVSLMNDKFIKPEGWEELTKPENDLNNIKQSPDSSTPAKNNAIINAELKAFAFFFNMENAGFAFSKLSQYLSFDTAKVDGVLSIEKRKNLRKEILSSNIVSEEDLKKLEQKSPISSFDNTKSIESVFNKFMPVISSNKQALYGIVDAYNSNYEAKSNKGARTLSSSIQNDFIYSIIYNFGEKAKNGFNLLTNITKTDENGKIIYKDIIDRMEAFKQSDYYKSIVKTFPVFDTLIANLHYRANSSVSPEIQSVLNIQMIKNSQMSIVEEEAIIYQFKQLLNEDIHKDPKVNNAIKTLVTDLFDLSLAQSGLKKSFLSFREYVPIQYFQKDMETALKSFYKLSPEQKAEYINAFKQDFQYNNKTYFPTIINENDKKLNMKNLNNSQNNIQFYNIKTAPIQIEEENINEFTETNPDDLTSEDFKCK